MDHCCKSDNIISFFLCFLDLFLKSKNKINANAVNFAQITFLDALKNVVVALSYIDCNNTSKLKRQNN